MTARLYGVPAGTEGDWEHVAAEDVGLDDVVQWEGESHIVTARRGRKLELVRLDKTARRLNVRLPPEARLQIARKPTVGGHR